jgi:hypothetical protein
VAVAAIRPSSQVVKLLLLLLFAAPDRDHANKQKGWECKTAAIHA